MILLFAPTSYMIQLLSKLLVNLLHLLLSGEVLLML